MSTPLAESKIKGSLFGGAIGDALGGPIEPWSGDPDRIENSFGTRRIETLVDYLPDGPHWYFRGSPKGTYTDDTILKNIVCQAIADSHGRIGAREFARAYCKYMRREYFTREPGQLWPGEAVVWFKLYFHITNQPYDQLLSEMPDARDMGQGNLPACDAAMMIPPVGLINAGDPRQASMDAVDVSSVLQSGVSATAPGALAAAVAAAMVPGAGIDEVLEAGVRHSDERTAARIRAAVELAGAATDADDFRRRFHDKMLLGLADALELVPATFGILALTRGDYRRSVVEGANFRRDSDTIAAMAGSVAGALHGLDVLPVEWVESVRAANPDQPALDDLAAGILAALRQEQMRGKRQLGLLDELLEPGSGSREGSDE
ncbi:MAG: hypothetical protein CME06_04040 [Gemmatimonadetes bacterium]|nr:hypothetical protein [Gemmatimonadota bacterium]